MRLGLTALMILATAGCVRKSQGSEALSRTSPVPTVASGACANAADTKVVLGFVQGEDVFRLTACTDYFEKASVSELLYRTRGQSDLVFSGKHVGKQDGLMAAIFSDTKSLDVELSNASAKVSIQGDEQSRWIIKLGDVVKFSGFPGQGDPLSACFDSPGGATETFRTLKLGTAELTLQMCIGNVGTSGGYAYEIVGFDLQDSHPKLAKPVKVSVRKADLAKVMKALSTHHNVCDQVVFTLPEATYAMSSQGSTLEGNTCAEGGFPEAPKKFEGKFGRFRVTYPTETVEGNLPTANFFAD